MNRGMYSSLNHDWGTPQWLFDDLDREFDFDLDVCATVGNAKCKRFFSPEEDGLVKMWFGRCYMNPPYGRHIAKWVRKAYEYSVGGGLVVCLLPARTDTAWWHDYVIPYATEIRFLRGRLYFEPVKAPAPMPSAVVVFGLRSERDG